MGVTCAGFINCLFSTFFGLKIKYYARKLIERKVTAWKIKTKSTFYKN